MSTSQAPATLWGLVSRFSPSGQEAEVVNWLVGHMQGLGYSRAFVDDAGSAVGILGDGERQLVLIGHIDTVPGEVPVRVEGDLLYGRGSVDAKGPLAAFVDAAAAVGVRPGWQIVVIGAVDEERDSLGARYAAGQYHPEMTIIGEPCRWDRVTLGYKGSAWAYIHVQQDLAHTAGQGSSACEAAIEIWQAVKNWAASYNAGQERLFDQALPALRGMDSGEDGFQEWACLRVGMRLPLEIGPQDWYARLAELAHGLVPKAKVEPAGFPVPAYQAEKNTPLVRAFLKSIRAEGGKPGFVLKTGTADLNIVAPQWGCPAVAYGPGDSALDHTPSEHTSIQEYRQAVAVLKGVLEEIA